MQKRVTFPRSQGSLLKVSVCVNTDYNSFVRSTDKDGSFHFADEIHIPGEGRSQFVTGGGWMLEIVKAASGDLYFFCDGEAVRTDSQCFGIYYPPFSIVEMFVREFHGTVKGVGSAEMQRDLPGSPTMFDVALIDLSNPRLVLSSAANMQLIPVSSKPSILSLRAKSLIDKNYQVHPSIRRIADRLNISHEHLSRQFKRDFHLSPSSYLHKLRMAEANKKLSAGEEIIDVSGEVGYNDLSRFYKQFRKQHQTSPGNCKATLLKSTPK